MKRLIIFLVVGVSASLAGIAANALIPEQGLGERGSGEIVAAAFLSAAVTASAMSDGRIELPSPQAKDDKNITFAK